MNHPPNYLFLRLLTPVVAEVLEIRGSKVACRSIRLLGTAAAREVEPSARKKVSKEERKAIVIEYVGKYRMMNAGKFPTATNIRKQVGGSYYVARSILQELEYNSKLPIVTTSDKNSTGGQTTKVIGISEVREAGDGVVPRPTNIISNTNGNKISVEIGSSSLDGISEVRGVSDTEMSARTITVKPFLPELEYHSKQHSLTSTDATSIIGQTTKVIEISEVREALDSDVPLHMGTVPNDIRLSSEGGFNCQNGNSVVREAPDNEVPRMTTIANECRFFAENGCYIPVELANNKFQGKIRTVETTDGNSTVEQMDKDGVRKVSDNGMHLCSTHVSDVYEISTEIDSQNKGEVGHRSCQTTLDVSILKKNEIAVEDFSVSETLVDLKPEREHEKISMADAGGSDKIQIVKNTGVMETINLEKAIDDEAMRSKTIVSEFHAKPDLPSEALSSDRSAKLVENDEASPPSSKSDKFARETQLKTPEKSLWGNLMSFASSFMSLWKKS